MKVRIFDHFLFGLLFTSLVFGQHNPNPGPEITAREIRHHIQYLASEEMQGRKAGTEYADNAAEYIAEEFRRYGLQPHGEEGSFYQGFEFVSDVELGQKNSLIVRIDSDHLSYTVKSQFIPLAFSKDTSVTGEVVFAGYGITARDLQYDSYANLDVKGKIVLVLRHGPEGDNPHGEFSKYTALRLKSMVARENGASALLVVSGPLDEEEDELTKLRTDFAHSDVGIPCFHIQRSIAERILSATGRSLREIQEKLNSDRKPISFSIPSLSVDLSSDVYKVRSRTKNVIGLIPGGDRKLKDEYFILGAHYDHLGLGGPGSLAPDTLAVHFGADDNASGTAGILELAQTFAVEKSGVKRSILFIAFGAEERGKLGSDYFVKHPVVPLQDIVGMINLDMIGREKDSTLIVQGTGTSPLWSPLLSDFNTPKRFNLKLSPGGFGPSDHSSFYAREIPVLFFFTGVHEDYHKPTDSQEKINAVGEQAILELVAKISREVLNREEKPLFTKADEPRRSRMDTGFRVYFGTVPDYAEQVEGLKLSAVRRGSPAEKAGLRGGDIITKFGGRSIKNVYDYTYALQDSKPGDEVEVIVQRGNEVVQLKAVLEKRGD